ncbi:MAG: hypothetical protein KDA65_08625 [Planctomycetaceae bacterium]|nr:hypothetical protein [Planctomycetaceae bacterium]
MRIAYLTMGLFFMLAMGVTILALFRTIQARKQGGKILFYLNENESGNGLLYMAIANVLLIFFWVAASTYSAFNSESELIHSGLPVSSLAWVICLMLLVQQTYCYKFIVTRRGLIQPRVLIGPRFVPWNSVTAVEEVPFNRGWYRFKIEKPISIDAVFRPEKEDTEFITTQLNQLLPEGVELPDELEPVANFG